MHLSIQVIDISHSDYKNFSYNEKPTGLQFV